MKITIPFSPKLCSALLAIGMLGTLILSAADPQPAAPTPTDQSRFGRGGGGPPGGGPGGGPGFGGQGFGNRGGWLDDQQRELIREAMQNSADDLRKLDEQLRAAQKELMQAILAENYDEKVVRQKAEAVAKIQVEQTMLRAKAFAKVAPTLKPEQRELLENSAWMLQMGGGFGGMRGGPPGQVMDQGGRQGGRDQGGRDQGGRDQGGRDQGGRNFGGRRVGGGPTDGNR